MEQALERRMVAADGVGIAYRGWGDANGGAPPVVLHHGFAVDANLNWVIPGVVAALVSAGRHVVALDARGHGRSDKPHDSAAYGEPTMARDLLQLLDTLARPAFDLVGYSMGSVVSLLAAVDDTRIERLVVGGVGAGVVEVGGLDTRAVPSTAIEAALRTDDPATIAVPEARPFRELVDAIFGDRLALAAQAAVVHQQPIALERIRARTLVLAGEVDPLAVRPEVLARAIPGATLQKVAGDHMSAVMNPDFAAAIVRFLARG